MSTTIESPLDSGQIDAENTAQKWMIIDRIGLYLAIGSFAIGTLIFLSYILGSGSPVFDTKAFDLIGIGMVYLFIAFFINLFVLIALIIIHEKSHSCGLLAIHHISS